MAKLLGAPAFTKAELREIERHKYYLSQQRGYDVGFDCAADDWLARFGPEFNRRQLDRMLSLQREEIARHVWIESQKHCRDMRREASIDWVQRYAAAWRRWYDATHGDGDDTHKDDRKED